jgi:hypothetical protein
MCKPSPQAVRWLEGYLRQTTPESRVFRAARQAGLDHRDIRQAARTLGVEIFSGRISAWWRMPLRPEPAQRADLTLTINAGG